MTLPRLPDGRAHLAHLAQVRCYNIHMTVAATSGNPFNPDSGTGSPLAAGRARERKRIRDTLEYISLELVEGGHEIRPGAAVIIHGPRLVGKTALLGFAKEQARLLGIKVLEVDNASLPLSRNLKFTLTARTLAKPVLLLVDDAHEIEPMKMYNLCIEFQSKVKSSQPLAMLMAGSAGLPMYIRETGAVFMERSNRMRVNLFTEEETEEALNKGFADSGMAVEPDALDRMAEWSGRHPQFIEMAGARTWDAVKGKGAGVVTMADAEAGLAEAERDRDGFYEERLGELLGSGVKPQAIQVMEMMRGQVKGLTDEKAMEGLMEANDGMDFEQAWGIMQELKDLGFLHKEGKRNREGVPKLFEYVRGKAAKEPAAP